MTVVGRKGGDEGEEGPTGLLGHHRARDGSDGGPVRIDFDRPHAGLVVGKRGSGKSYTLGVLAEELARSTGVVPVVVDPMGCFTTLAAEPVHARVHEPRVRASALPPRAWCELVDLDLDSGPGSLLWQAATACDHLPAMQSFVAEADVPAATRRTVANLLRLAASWDVFDPEGLAALDLVVEPTVLDCSGLDRAPANAVVAAAARSLYRARVDGHLEVLPWLLIDEVHTFLAGIAAGGLRQILTRGRQPGVSLVAATQRPGALPPVAASQSDLLVAHRLTDRQDREALRSARPAYMERTFAERMPTRPGQALVVDDSTESVRSLTVRERETPHGGGSPRASSG